MTPEDLTDWMDSYAQSDTIWYVKRLSANDTLASGGHQAGPYIPKGFLFEVLPDLKREEKNPDVWLNVFIDSHSVCIEARAVWYNNRFHDEGGTRDEARITNWGGSSSVVLDPENTGSLVIFSFLKRESPECHVWLCESELEEELVQQRIGSIEPGETVIWSLNEGRRFERREERQTCHLSMEEIPQEWLEKFPSGVEIIRKSIELRSEGGSSPDKRLVRRRECEYQMFQSVEEAFWLPKITRSFSSIEDFVGTAQSILQSRKSRSGNSLELHAKEIFLEEGLQDTISFSHRPVVEDGKKPDFLFPSQQAYDDPMFPSERLAMLAVKTTCKDRWRQILNEADRIQSKHLLTLQEGVSENQFSEMKNAGVKLVVPDSLHKSYPSSIREELVTLGCFIDTVKDL